MEAFVSRTTWDALVIGAGPAGALAATHLARRGASVLLCERGSFQRDKLCGEFLSPDAVASGSATTRISGRTSSEVKTTSRPSTLNRRIASASGRPTKRRSSLSCRPELGADRGSTPTIGAT